MSAIPRELVEDVHALSAVQQGIFFHALLEPELAPYVEQGLWRIRGAVVPEIFEQAWNALAARHTILRSVFRQTRRQPVQIVLKERRIEVPCHDLTALAPDAQRRALHELAQAERAPFPLADGPLLRLALVRLGTDEWRFLWSFHHIILDGLTAAMLLESLCTVYDELASGGAVRSNGVPPFGRFILWLARQNGDEAQRFFARHLEGFTTPTSVPGDRLVAETAQRTHRACHVWLGRETTTALEELARKRRVTVSTLMQAVWAIVLGRYSGEPDVVFGLTLSGRPADLAGVERIAGPFINTLPVRVPLAGDPALADVLRSLQQQFVELDQYSHVSLAEIQGRTEIRPPAVLFETAVNVHPPARWNGFRAASFVLGLAREEGPPVTHTNYDLMVDVALLDSIGITISYAEEMYDRATVEALLANMKTLAGAMAAGDPDARVSSLCLLSPDTRARVTRDFSCTGSAAPFDGGAVARIEAQAAQRPTATAVIGGSTRLTYEELDARANQIASWLRAQGIGCEDRVAVFGERGAGWLTFVLGILKARAAFVPLDPMQPDARLATIVGTCGARVMACGAESTARGASLAESAPNPPSVVCWDEALPTADSRLPNADGRPTTDNRPQPAAPKDLACVFFTSGSTGVPKGVMVEHAGVLNHLNAKIDVLGIDSTSVVAQNASIGFDISVWQMLAALTVGGTVAIYPDEIAFDQSRLVAGLARDRVTILETVPSLMDALIDAVSRLPVPSLRVLVSNAEFLPVPLCRRWLQRFPHIPLVNTYGPTECSDDNTHYWQPEPPSEDTIRVPIGRPVAGGRMYVLDRVGEPVPIGAPGEIAMGGVMVGRGYLDDPVRTALAFVPDPFSPEPGARMYLSGDIARWTNAGLLEWLRRDGDQVKVRGHRIELGEIQSALLRHPGVRQAIAIVREKTGGEPQIVAYVVGDATVDTTALREALVSALPRYMLPSAIMRLGAFPVTSNGKLNRRALPAPPEDQAETAFVAPADPVEAAIAEIWAEVLGVERVGANDNFFELGGQSLRSLQIRSRLVQRFGIDVPLRAIFRNQTVREQARIVAELLAGRETPAAGIPRLPDAESYALSHAQRRLWFVHQLDPSDTSYNLLAPVVLEGSLDQAAFERAWSGLLARHDSLRTIFEKVGGEPVQRILPPVASPPAHLDLSHLSDRERPQELERLLAEARNTAFALDTPPVHALLVTLAPERHLFAIVLHHLVSDGWSGDVLLRDLLELYRAARTGESPVLAPMPIRYVDYAAWQKARVASGAFAEDEQYWVETLAGELPALAFPARQEPKPAAAPDVHTVRFAIDAETAERLRGATGDRDVTPFMLRLALVKAWLARVTGGDDLLVGSPVAGRDRPETEALAGFFVNLLPLRTALGADPSFPQVVERVQRSCLEAYAHQDYPFDEIVRRVNPAREPHRLPIFDVMFVSARQGGSRTVEGLTVAAASGTSDRAPMIWPGVTLPVTLLAACIEEPTGALSWTLSFDAGRIAGVTAERAAAQFEAVLRGIARRPRARLSTIGIDDASRREILPQLPRSAQGSCPLSIAQRDVWAASALRPGSSLGTLSMQVTIDGELDDPVFVEVLRAAAHRHEAFRLTFAVEDGEPVQRIGPAVRLAVHVENLQPLGSDAQHERVRAVEDDLARAFDLSAAPLARAALLRLGSNRHVLVLAWHQLIVDAWHIGELVEEVADAYARRVRGDRPAVAGACAGPTDVALSQSARLASGSLLREANYWRAALERARADAALPSDRTPRRARTFRAATLARTLPPETAKAIRATARAQRTTTLRVVTAAFAALVTKLTRQRDCVIAMPMSARRPAAGSAIGPFVHDVPVCLRVEGNMPFETLVGDVTTRIAVAHDCREFAAVDLSRERDARRRPIAMAIARARKLDFSGGGVRLRAGLPERSSSQYDLAVAVVDDGADLELHVTFATELFDHETVERWCEYLAAGLAGAAADPAQRTDRVGFISFDDREWLVHGLNMTARPYPATMSLHRLFEAEAGARPGALALHGPSAVVVGPSTSLGANVREWTYAELNGDANRLARRLVAEGVGPGTIAAAFLERSPDYAVAVLAILKTGAAYLPLDPGDPPERLRVMLEDAGTAALVTTAALVARVPEGAASRVVAIDRDAAAIASEAPENLAFDGNGESLCHVMYTSGSTGRPKGVMIPHRSVTHFVRETNWVLLRPSDRVAQLAKCSFDASTWEVWGALLNGATLVTIPADIILSPFELASAFAAHGITAAALTPALFNQMARETPGCFRNMRYLFSGGDVMNPRAARLVLDQGAPERLINVYGPTENSSLTTYQVVDVATTALTTIPVGRPISNTQVYIVDAAFQPVGIGIPGEVCVGGEGLSHGYWQQPELTADRFVPDPFGGVPGARLYVTGDLARWRPDGSVDFIGRVDHQVKIRGHRVEFGEIEAALRRHEDVTDAVVVVRTGRDDIKQLAAYVVPAPGAVIAPDVLRRHVSAHLPSYMVPTWIVPLAALPLTATRKVDRRALPEPDDERAMVGVTFAAPRTTLESGIAAVWQKVLRVDRVGIHDNFFDLGGDSIQCIVAVSQLAERGIRTTPKTFYTHPTVAGLAAAVGSSGAPVAPDEGPVSGPAPLLPVQRFILEQDLEGRHHWNVGAFLRSERLDAPAVARAFQAVLDHHDALRMRFTRGPGGWEQHNAPVGEAASFEVVEIGDDLPRLTAACARIQGSLDLEHGPLFRGALFRLADGTDRLLVIAHHLVSDIVSSKVLAEDIGRAYDQALARQEQIVLSRKTTSYRRWAQMLDAHAPERMRELPYWQSVVEQGWPFLALDHNRGPNSFESLARVRIEIDADVTRALLTKARQAFGMEMHDVLLAAVARTFGAWTGDPVVGVLVEGHGREEIFPDVDLSRTMGWFTSFYPLRLDSGRGTDPAEHLRRTRETLGEVPDRGIGYGLLRYMLRRPELDGRPLPDISFNYQGQVAASGSAQRFTTAPESPGDFMGVRGPRVALFNVECVIYADRLFVVLVYSRNAHRAETIDGIAQRLARELRELAAACAAAPVVIEASHDQVAAGV